MQQKEANELLQKQQAYFQTGATLPVSARKQALRALAGAIDAFEQPLYQALQADLGKSRTEGFLCEVGLCRSELSYMLRHVSHFAREKRVHTPLAQFASRSYEKPSPYGNVLIMSPWNYPVLLTLEPLIDALAAGNTAVLKPSAYAPQTAEVLTRLIQSVFPEEFVAVVNGGREANQCLLGLDFDYIFFTGSKTVGKEVMRRAAEHLVPLTLELGGKSPCVVDETANLPLAAKRIVFGKFLNCGQTCVAPDYLYCHESVKQRLIEELKKQITLQYGENPLANPSYGKIVNAKHFRRLCGLLDGQHIACGGECDEQAERIAPTVLDETMFEDAVMGEEIFGPILPVLTYKTTEEAIRRIRSMPHPLAFYVFSSDRRTIRTLTASLSFGGGCVNDTLIHLATSGMGFGGVGESGMGAYHGKHGFETFTHTKSIVDKKTWLDLPIRYQPYTAWKERLARWFVR